MSDTIIKVENVSKRFMISHESKERYTSLRDQITQGVKGVFRSGNKNKQTQQEEFWALRDLNFEIKRGDRVGIIGRNGAGKSTLLKVLSRITEPSSGRMEIDGRVASLLEVGTGFHPELTGRENIFLNGAILGMSRAEIRSKFNDIVAFAEIEKFLDTPVKRYSSGMYVRLAFAVAAHLEPEILIVDEVLAVGDAQFQKKCLGKMEDVSNNGRTVLFVSHDMNAILRLCQKVVLMEKGMVKAFGPTKEIVNKYLGAGVENHAVRVWSSDDRPGNDIAKLISVSASSEGSASETFDIRKPIKLSLQYEVLKGDQKLTHALVFHNEAGVRLFDSHDINSAYKSNSLRAPGIYEATLTIPGNFFSEGKVKVSPAVITSDPFHLHAYEEDAIAFMIVDSVDGDSVRGQYAGTYLGVVRPLFSWDSKFITA